MIIPKAKIPILKLQGVFFLSMYFILPFFKWIKCCSFILKQIFLLWQNQLQAIQCVPLAGYGTSYEFDRTHWSLVFAVWRWPLSGWCALSRATSPVTRFCCSGTVSWPTTPWKYWQVNCYTYTVYKARSTFYMYMFDINMYCIYDKKKKISFSRSHFYIIYLFWRWK